MTRAPMTVTPEPWPASQARAPTRMPSRGRAVHAGVGGEPADDADRQQHDERAQRRERAAEGRDQHQRTRPGSVGPRVVGSGEERRHGRPIITRPAAQIALPRRPSATATTRGEGCAPRAPLPYRGAVMRSPETFDAYYVETRTRLLHEAYALTGDAPASRAAVRDAFVVAWHHWRKVGAARGPRRLRPPARPRPRPPPAHRPHLAPRQVARPRGAQHPRRAVQAHRAPARAARPQRHLRALPRRGRPHGRPAPRRRRARAADRELAVLAAPRRPDHRHPAAAPRPRRPARGHPLAPRHRHPSLRRRATSYAHRDRGRPRHRRARWPPAPWSPPAPAPSPRA